jgi:phenylacetate-CoA ligase
LIRFFDQPASSKVLLQNEVALTSALQELRNRSAWTRTDLETFQTETLKIILKYAYDSVPLYRKKYDAAGFQPSQFKSLNDLRLIPILTKAELRPAGLDDLCSANFSDAKRLLSTSGSTGKPVRLFRSEISLWRFTAYNMRLYYDWCNAEPISNVLYFIDSVPNTIDYALADHLRTTVSESRILSTYEHLSILAENVWECTPEFISSYPTTMRGLAVYMKQQKSTLESVRLIHVTSEMMDAVSRRLVLEVFPRARIIDTYTSTEAGLVGYPCPVSGGMHLAEDNGIFEIIDHTGNPTDGLGELLVTDLTNFATPVIRYSGLGDLCRWADQSCTCGSLHRRIAQLEGRYVDSIVLPDGSMQSPYLLTNAMGEVSGIFHYQIIQLALERFDVKVVIGGSGIDRERVQADIRAVFAGTLNYDTDCRIEFVDEIPLESGRHKIPVLISKVMKAGAP